MRLLALLGLVFIAWLSNAAAQTPYPSRKPTSNPTMKPTKQSTSKPSKKPTPNPTARPTTASPTFKPFTRPDNPPNVLLLIADDFKPLMEAYGSPFVTRHHGTPNLDALARQSINFMNAQTQMALCGPSRASFLTSLRPNTVGVTGLKKNALYKQIQASKQKGSKQILLLPKMFKMAGYRTLGMGKIFHHEEYDLCDAGDVWTEPNWTHLSGLKRPAVFTNPFSRSWINSPDVADEYFADGQLARLAAKTIREDLGTFKQQPWFLAVGFYKPHLPFEAPKRYFDLVGQPVQYSMVYNIGTITNLTPQQTRIVKGRGCTEVKSNYVDTPNVNLGYPNDSPIEVLQQATHGYHAAAMYMDAQVGIVLDALKASEHRDNTIVVFLGDHGFHLGDHGLYCKHSNFEQALKVPFLISPALRDKTTQRNTRAYAPVELLDLMPTLRELAGLKSMDLSAYRPFEGQSLVPVMNDAKNGFVKPAAYSQYSRNLPKEKANVNGWSMRTTRYRLTKWTGTHSFVELYDYLLDAGETYSYHKDKGLLRVLTRQIGNRMKKESARPFDFEDRTRMAALTPLQTP